MLAKVRVAPEPLETYQPSRATLETCSQYCYSRGYTFYAMQMGTTCFCDDDYVK